ncbi:MAG: hypothetical protein ACI8W7_002061, partial [Gammaproteobacteria bacterium]
TLFKALTDASHWRYNRATLANQASSENVYGERF